MGQVDRVWWLVSNKTTHKRTPVLVLEVAVAAHHVGVPQAAVRLHLPAQVRDLHVHTIANRLVR